MTFEAITEEQWKAIRSTRNWAKGTDWRSKIDEIGRDYWDFQAARQAWVNRLRGKQPAKQREKINKILTSIRQSHEALARVADDGLLDDDFPRPDVESVVIRLEAWLSDYDIWVNRFAGKSDPIQSQLEWRLMDLWKRSGGKLHWSRKKDDPGTPYAPLIDFLTLAIKAIVGRALGPSGIAKMIDRHRGQRRRDDPFLMYVMHARITGSYRGYPQWDAEDE
jgi:hypothetical protein